MEINNSVDALFVVGTTLYPVFCDNHVKELRECSRDRAKYISKVLGVSGETLSDRLKFFIQRKKRNPHTILELL